MLRPTASAIETRVVDGPCGESADQKDAEFVRRMDVFYYNRSRHGKIKKHVNEKYLRRSAFCGLRTCSKCEGGEFETHRLNPTALPNRVMSLPHSVVVDSKVLVKFIDLFQENVFQNVLIPLSAWKSVKSNHRKIFLKLRETYESNPSNFFVFGNDSFVETMPVIPLSRVDGENLLIATAADFLLKHWHDRRVVPIVLAVNEADMKAIGEHYKYVTTVFNYIKGMPKDEKRRLLIERVRALSKEEDARSKKAHFEYYINETQLTDGVRSGVIKVGKFTVTYENYQEAYVTIDDSDRVLVHGRAAMNRAISGDKVAVEILPESEWRAPEGRFRTKEADQAKEDDEIGDEQKDESSATLETPKVKTGKVVSIIDRPLKHYCGILEAPNIKGGSICLFRPADKRIPPVRISNRGYHSAAADGSAGKKVVCSIVRWPADSTIPEGSLIRVLGDIGDKKTEEEVILLEHDIRSRPFTADERAELPSADWRPANPLEPYRQDLRHLDVCSVDPEGCTDIDDALHFCRLPNGNVEVGVHIADVSHFVRADSPLDLEASRRGTTVYLSGRRIDMLPELLSSNLCSLRANEERYAFSVLWEMNEAAEIVGEPRFTKSVIRSRRAYTYQQAQDIIDKKKEEDAVFFESLNGLLRLSKIMRERRRQRGSLTLASMEIRFVFDENHKPVEVQEKADLATMSMIEDFMLQANVSVAEAILNRYPDVAMLRRHPQPTPDAFEPLIKAGKAWNFEIDTSTNQALARSLQTAVVPGNEDVNRMLRMLATRCMTQAVYFPAGASAEHQHYGLAIPTYTHFTSPIRRYADIVVHRQLGALLGVFEQHAMPKMFKRFHLENVSEEINRRNRLAQRAARASALLQAQFLLENKPGDADGFVTMVRDNGVTVVVKAYGVESIIEYPPNCPVTLRLFQKVRVHLCVTERNQRRFLDLKIVDPPLEAAEAEVRPAEVPVDADVVAE